MKKLSIMLLLAIFAMTTITYAGGPGSGRKKGSGSSANTEQTTSDTKTKPTKDNAVSTTCKGTTKDGKPCKNKTKDASGFCKVHKSKAK